MVTSDQLRRAGDLLDRRFGLETLWLFGSQAKGTAGPGSDVDLAALFRRRPTPLEVLDIEGELADLLGRPVEVIDLDRASPILGMQVLRYGRLLVDRNPARRLSFFGRTLNLYDDLKIVRRETERALFRRATHGRS